MALPMPQQSMVRHCNPHTRPPRTHTRQAHNTSKLLGVVH